MGRYYSGDIEGKFWFAIQSSNAADRFGVTGETPSTLWYFFDESNLDDINAEIKNIEDKLGFKKIVIDKFFADNNMGWSDDKLKEAHITKAELEDYADLELGKKIRDCVVEFGSCSFDAEC
jgi:hypothetical protein